MFKKKKKNSKIREKFNQKESSVLFINLRPKIKKKS